MGYYVDLATITLDDFFVKVKDVSVLPSQAILRESPEDKLRRLKATGIRDLRELQAIFKSKGKTAELAKKTGLTEEYLTFLRRELDRYQPKPISFKDIPELKKDVLEKLDRHGIRNTMDLFDRVVTVEGRKELAEETGIALEDVLELTKLADVARVMWSTPTFVRLLVAAGCDSVGKIVSAGSQELYERLTVVNREKTYLKARLSEKDTALFVRYAKDVPQAIDW